MRVNFLEMIIYTFTNEEQKYLKDIGVWYILKDRLKPNERIEIEQS
jgi:hypothetical protein